MCRLGVYLINRLFSDIGKGTSCLHDTCIKIISIKRRVNNPGFLNRGGGGGGVRGLSSSTCVVLLKFMDIFVDLVKIKASMIRKFVGNYPSIQCVILLMS